MRQIAFLMILGVFLVHGNHRRDAVCKAARPGASASVSHTTDGMPIVLVDRGQDRLSRPPTIVPPPIAIAAALSVEPDGDDLDPSIVDGATPSWFWGDEPEEGDALEGRLTIKGRPSATRERAEKDARVHLVRRVSEWLNPDVPLAWATPESLVDELIADRHVETIEKDYGTIFLSALRVEFAPERRAEIVEAYNRQLVGRRLLTLGGGLGFALVCLAATAGYIRADEATKGYYTNRLRLLAAAGVGAAGVALYHAIA